MSSSLRVWVPVVLILSIAGCGFATTGYSTYDPPGFFHGVWHGLIAPWSLILRLFFDIKMYAFPNSGWFYDLGFFIGMVFSIPFGWIAAIIALIVYLV